MMNVTTFIRLDGIFSAKSFANHCIVYLNKRPFKYSIHVHWHNFVCFSRVESNCMRNLMSEHLRSVFVGWNETVSIAAVKEKREKRKKHKTHTHTYAFNKCYFLGCSIRHDRSYSSSLMLLIFFCSLRSLTLFLSFSFTLHSINISFA